MYGKELRMAKIMSNHCEKLCIVPLDHGITMGAIHGIERCYQTILDVNKGGANGIVVHKGLLKMIAQYPELASQNYIMHLSASSLLSNNSDEKVLVGSVEEAIKLGATGISMHVNFGTNSDKEMLRDLGIVSKHCLEWGMPLLVMTYVKNVLDDGHKIAHAARIAQELGADLIKVSLPNNEHGIQEILSGVTVPVIVAGGTITNDYKKYLSKMHQAVKLGASGVAIGRNIFSAEDRVLMTKLIKQLINDKLSLEECMERLNQENQRGK